MRKTEAFTLIELLIVVAIIAILAAIAVPNFLEAQVRSKVARVKADMRSAAAALESYMVDYNRPMFGVQEIQQNFPSLYVGNSDLQRKLVWARLTTPVAYLTTAIFDPFVLKSSSGVRTNFTYQSFVVLNSGSAARRAAYARCHELGYKWGICSFGPYRQSSVVSGPNGMPYILAGTNNEGGPGLFVYDSTNGTRSAGMIIRTNKGEHTGP